MSLMVGNPPLVEIDKGTLKLWQKLWNRDAIQLAVERVNRGANLLDAKRPGWEKTVAPQKLEMANASFCIIGQAYGDYGEVRTPFGFAELDEGGPPEKEVDQRAVEHGFYVIDEIEDGYEYTTLDYIWVYLLQERAEKGRPVYLKLP